MNFKEIGTSALEAPSYNFAATDTTAGLWLIIKDTYRVYFENLSDDEKLVALGLLSVISASAIGTETSMLAYIHKIMKDSVPQSEVKASVDCEFPEELTFD